MNTTRRITISFVSLLVAALLIWPALCLAQPRDFKEQDLNKKDFSNQRLDGADFSGALLEGANFSRASLKGANFQEARLLLADFTQADLTGADFRNSLGPFGTSEGTNFSSANFEGLDLKGQIFQNPNFRGANLRNTIGWYIFADANFRGADLRGANLLAAVKSPRAETVFRGAIYDDNTVWPAWLDAERSGARKATP